MTQISNDEIFKEILPRELLEATYKAVSNFQIRSFYEAKEEILNCGKYSEKEFYDILDAMIDAETERKILMDRLKGQDPLFLTEIAELINDFPPINIVRDVIYLKEQGYIDELVEVKTKKVIKKIKGVEKEVEEKEYFYRYKLKKLEENFKENFFQPVSIIFESGVCCNCGWCSSICPINAINVNADDLEIDKNKCIKCGLCFSVCPRSFQMSELWKAIGVLSKEINYSEKIGPYINAYTATTTIEEIKKVRQDGGIATTILEYLLKNNLVDAIIAVQHSKDLWKPEPVIIEDVKDLYKTSGTKYANSPSLIAIEKAKNYDKIAVVGTPCMMKALVKGELFPSGFPFFNNIKYKIGLFCMEAFSYDNIIKLVKDKFDRDINELTKMNIDKGKFIINLKSGEELKIDLKEIQPYARGNCHFCEDLTSEYADFSVGSIGSQSGYSSVITRTLEADTIFQDMISSGLVEAQNLKDIKPGLGLVQRISASKKKKCKTVELKKEN